MTLPDPGMTIHPEHTALVLTDPQNDFLSPNTVWATGEAVTAIDTAYGHEHAA